MALRKIVRRNFAESKESRTLPKDQLKLPCIFLQFGNESNTTIRMDESRKNLIVDSNSELNLMNENHVLEELGFAQTNESEIAEMFNTELV